MILLTAAVTRELEFWTPRHDVETLVTGVGPVEAAAAVAHALGQQRFKLVVNAGIAGAIHDAAAIGDGVAIVSEALELALENGHPIFLPAGETVVDQAHSDRVLVGELQHCGFAALRGITVTHVTATDETAARLSRLGAQVESMEGFAVLRAAERAVIPAIELRGISNRVGARESSGWSFEAGIAGLQRITTALFEILDAAGKQPA
jgi:futalosine hydrolase